MDYSTTPQRRRRPDANELKAFAKKHKKPLLIGLALFLAFYWYEIRPVKINNVCANQASANARSLLRDKAAAATDPDRREGYNRLIEQNNYLRSDYEAFYKKCLRSYGVFI